jgi:ABC-type polysaccharide/polyol phosphate export permease
MGTSFSMNSLADGTLLHGGTIEGYHDDTENVDYGPEIEVTHSATATHTGYSFNLYSRTVGSSAGPGTYLASGSASLDATQLDVGRDGGTGTFTQSGAANLVKNIVFKTEALPLAAVLAAVVPGVIGLLCLGILLLADGQWPTWHAVFVLPVLALQLLLLAGLGLWLGATAVFVRDLVHVMPLVTSLILFLSPIFYPREMMPEWVQGVTYFNPFYQMVCPYREALTRHCVPDLWGLLYLAACLLHGPIPPPTFGEFVNNLYFLVLTGVIVVTGSYFHSKSRFREFAFRYELDKNRKELEKKHRLRVSRSEAISRLIKDAQGAQE